MKAKKFGGAGNPQGKNELAESVVAWREEPCCSARSGLGNAVFEVKRPPHAGTSGSGACHVQTVASHVWEQRQAKPAEYSACDCDCDCAIGILLASEFHTSALIIRDCRS